jgi:putative PIN family toxin of toxin-antitoxin system
LSFPLSSTIEAAVVLDTNVVLDWLVFRDPSVGALARLVTEGRVRWLVSSQMRAELDSVLTRNAFARWAVARDEVFQAWDRWAHPVLDSGAPAHGASVRCADPDDQKFIDLAIACGARWLFTRDRALLDLARQSRAFGVEVVSPSTWLAQTKRAAEAALET